MCGCGLWCVWVDVAISCVRAWVCAYVHVCVCVCMAAYHRAAGVAAVICGSVSETYKRNALNNGMQHLCNFNFYSATHWSRVGDGQFKKEHFAVCFHCAMSLLV